MVEVRGPGHLAACLEVCPGAITRGDELVGDETNQLAIVGSRFGIKN
jgi:hypothetical protein